MMFFSFDTGFSLFSSLFSVAFIAIFGIIIVAAVRGIAQWNQNNHSPRLTVQACITGKRSEHHHHHHDNMDTSSTTYYVTFQVQSGDQMELRVNGWEYGQLAEGDVGNLTFQGTRYLGFERY